MDKSPGRTLLGLLTFLALASTLLTLAPTVRVSGQAVSCPVICISGQGQCLNGSCLCNPGWVGRDCSVALCSSDAECDDADPCTTDRCDAASGLCRHTANIAACLDSFKCYKAGLQPTTPKFVSQEEQLADDFDAKTATIAKPALLCPPVSRDGRPITNGSLGIECYKIKDVRGQAKFAGAEVESQTSFGTDPLRIKGGKLLCVPAALRLPAGPEPVDCVVSEWSEFGPCSAECGDGRRTRTREVLIPEQNGGRPCSLVQLSEHWPCNTHPCPVDCVVSEWSEWSECSMWCGPGTKFRTREVLTPAQHGGAECPLLLDTLECNSQQCPVDCVVGEWSQWSPCSAECGGGSQFRTREVHAPAGPCPPSFETRECNTQPCPIDCVVDEWSEWSPCSAECGEGSQFRIREVLTPAQDGGQLCPELSEVRECYEECP